VFTPSGSPPPTPRSPRDHDEWIAIVVALGVLGGVAGWILVGGFPQVNPSLPNAGRPGLEGTSQDPLGRTSSETATDASGELRTDGQTANAQGTARGGQARDLEATSRLGLPRLVPETSGSANPSVGAGPGDGEGSPRDLSPELVVPQPELPANEAAGVAIALQAPLVFSDLPDTHWSKPFVDGLTARGKLAGFPDGSYQPDKAMTRAELAAQLNQAFALLPKRSAQAFSDIPAGYWATESINKAVETGFMTGYPGGIFSPDQTVPRVQVIAAIAAGLNLNPAQLPDTVLAEYADQASIPPWARDAVAAAVEVGLVGVTTSQPSLRPNDFATRAEVAALLYKALVYMGEAEPL
jgi:hypothetical protein